MATFMAAALMLSACAPVDNAVLEEDLPEEVEVVTEEFPMGTFIRNGEGNYSGTIFAKGYGEVVDISEGFCDPAVDECAMVKGVSFVVTEHNTPGFAEFQEDYAGNSFVGEGFIGLGCVEEGRIFYINSSDGAEFAEYEIDEALTEKILAATEDEPITLKFNKDLLTFGSGAPDCYSHFTSVEEYEG